MAHILSVVPVGHEKAKKALDVAPHVVMVVTMPPAKPQPLKCSFASPILMKTKSAPRQTSPQVGPILKGQTFSLHAKVSSAKPWPSPGHEAVQKKEGSSSCKFSSHSCLYKSFWDHGCSAA